MTVRPSSIKVRLLKFANLGRPDGAFKKTNVYEGGRAGILPHFILVYMEHPCRDRNWQRGIALWPPRRWRAIAVERKAQKRREEQEKKREEQEKRRRGEEEAQRAMMATMQQRPAHVAAAAQVTEPRPPTTAI